MATYIQFKGSPDVFDVDTGKYISYQEAQKIPNFFSRVKKLDIVRPDITNESQFSLLAGKDINPQALASVNLPVSKITPTSPIKTVSSSSLSPSSDFATIMAGIQSALTPTEKTPAQLETERAQQEILKLLQQQGEQSAYQLEQEQQFGVPEKSKTVQDLTAQLNQLNAEAAAEQLRLQTRPQEGTFLKSGLQAELSQLEANRASRALILSAQLQAAQGNLTFAQAQVDRAVALKYEPIKNQLEMWKTIYQMNRDTLTSEEKRRGDIIDKAYSIYLNQLDIQQTREKNFESTVNTALANGAPLLTVNQARQLYAQGNEDGARALIAPYTGAVSLDKQTSGTKGGTLTITEAKNLGLPLGLVGKSEAEVMAEINSDIPPAWFRQMAEQQAKASLTDAALRELWKQFQTRFSTVSTSSTSTSSGTKLDQLLNMLK